MSVIDKYIKNGLNYAAITGGITMAISALGGLSGTAGGVIEALESLQQPALCYIPIQSETLTLRRMADIGTTMIIAQTEQQKKYVTDNLAPRPKVWSGRGYIKSLAPELETGLLVKPTLLVQQAILEAAADSRQPVKFKTDTGEVVDVLVQDLQITSLEKGTNAKMVTYVVQEVTILENAVTDTAKVTGKAAAASIPVRAVVNLGKNVLVGAAVTTGTAGLLSVLKR